MLRLANTVSLQRANIYRILTLLAGIAACLALTDGKGIFVASAMALLAYLLVDLRRVSQFIQLDSVWVVAFLAVICGEGIFDAQIITLNVHRSYYDLAAKYINIINFIFLIGLNLIHRYWPDRQVKSRTPLQTTRVYGPILAIFYAAFLVVAVPAAWSILVNGRFEVVGEGAQVRGLRDLLGNFLGNLSLILPAMLAYHFLFVRNFSKRQALFWFILSYLPILLLQVASGTRYPLVVSLISLLVIYSSRYPFGWLRSLKLVLLGAVALVVTTLMRELRGFGLSTDFSSLSIGSGERFSLGEGTVTYFAKMIEYFGHTGFRNGLEHLAVALFWVPRAVWPDKPTQLEYWFPRAYGETGFSEGHSIAATFAATAFADFGFVGACLLWALLGIGAGHLNRWCTRFFYVTPGHPNIVIASVVVGLTFFTVRQISTIVFTVVSVLLLWLIYRRGFVPRQASVGLPAQRPDEQIAVGQLPRVGVQQGQSHRLG